MKIYSAIFISISLVVSNLPFASSAETFLAPPAASDKLFLETLRDTTDEQDTAIKDRAAVRELLGTLRERIIQGKKIITLELMPPKRMNPEDKNRFEDQKELCRYLYHAGLIDGVTMPDLPDLGVLGAKIVRKLYNFLKNTNKSWLFWLREMSSQSILFEDPIKVTPEGIPGYFATIAAQTRDRAQIKWRIKKSVQQGATVLFFVSGSHPLRKVPVFNRIFCRMNTIKMLELAREMQDHGEIPADIVFSASENTNTGPVEKTVARSWKKNDHGAGPIFTQAQFFRNRSETWFEKLFLRKGGDPVTIKPIVGIAQVTSAKNLEFWFALNGINPMKNPLAQELLKQWQKAEETGQLKDFRNKWNTDICRWAYGLPGISGVHIVSLTNWRQIPAIIENAGITVERRLHDDVNEPGTITAVRKELKKYGIELRYASSLEQHKDFTKLLWMLRQLPEAVKTLHTQHSEFLKGLHIYFDRIRYNKHFRAPISYRPSDNGWHEIAIDIRQHKNSADFVQSFLAHTRLFAKTRVEAPDGIVIDQEPVPHQSSVIYNFSDAFWHNQDEFMAAKGERSFDKAIGETSDLNPKFLEANVIQFLDLAKAVHEDNPKPVYIEIGIAGTKRFKAFAQLLKGKAIARAESGVLGRMTYVFADYSRKSLEKAESELGSFSEGIKLHYIHLHAENPYADIADDTENLSGRILVVHATNVYDTVRTNFLARMGDKFYLLLSQAYLPIDKVKELTATYGKYGITDDFLTTTLPELGSMGIDEFFKRYRSLISDKNIFHRFWQDLFNGITLREFYAHIPDIQQYSWIDLPDLENPNRLLEDVLRTGSRNVWVPDSKYAIQGTLSLMKLLHQKGFVQLTQIGVNEVTQMPDEFQDLRKYDGAVALPVLGPLYREVAKQMGYQVTVRPFTDYDPKKKASIIIEVHRFPQGDQPSIALQPAAINGSPEKLAPVRPLATAL